MPSTDHDLDDMYDSDVILQLTASQERVLDVLEAIHQPVSESLKVDGHLVGPSIQRRYKVILALTPHLNQHPCRATADPYKAQSQPDLSRTSKVLLPPQPSSQPGDPRSAAARADRMKQAGVHRIARTFRLNRYMKVLRGRCPLHFARRVELVSAENHSGCEELQDWPTNEFYAFKRGFTFTPFSYCFQCCLPQSRNHNGEEPACHAGFSYKKGETCPFAGFIFMTVFCLWHSKGVRQLIISDVASGRMLSTVEDFLAWAVEEDADEGKYNNCLETFLWFCARVEKAKPDFFI